MSKSSTTKPTALPDLSEVYIPLHVHSAYSLLEGAVTIKDLLGLATSAHMPALALTDTNNLFGALEFASGCAAMGIQPIIGCQIRLDISPVIQQARESEVMVMDHLGQRESSPHYPIVLLAQSEVGYQNLVALSSRCFLDDTSTEAPHISMVDLESKATGLICLTGGYGGPLNRLLGERLYGAAMAEDSRERPHKGGLHKGRAAALKVAEALKGLFGDRLYIELTRMDTPDQAAVEEGLLHVAQELALPIVATNPVYFKTPQAHRAHDALLCVADSTYVSVEDRRRLTHEFFFKTAQEMKALFADIPQALENTVRIAKRCHYFPQARKPILPAYQSDQGLTEEEELKRQAKEGLDQRLKTFVYTPDMSSEEKRKVQETYLQRLTYEIDVICQMGFAGYFLIVSDFIKWAKSKGIPVGPGRGSGAGSATAWCLFITDMDPLRFHLIFERFLNPERVSMPDFDVDFCQERRDEVITYVQQKYGQDRVAQIITFGKLQARAVLRDVGRVLQMPYGQVDRICKLVPNNPANPLTLQEALEAEPKLAAERENDETVAELIDISLQLEGLYRHASTHAAGVVIADRPIQELVPLYRDPKSSMPVTQFNMKMVEQAGLVKFDFLGLKTLTVIRKASEIIQAASPDFDISTIPLDDPATFELLRRVETVGIFQLESAGMSDVVRQLQPEHFDELIALVALYRPGPMDDIPRYIACRHGREAVSYMHPDLEPILKDSYGVMVYQEQVMWIARELAGYSLGEADLLRRAMGKKIKSEMDKQRRRFVDGATERGLKAALAQELFDKIAKFASYAFPKAHAAPYALLSYQTAYLKANHPLAFYAASLTLDSHNTDKITVFKQDMQKLGFQLLPPDINRSGSLFQVETQEGSSPSSEKGQVENTQAVRYALGALKGVGVQAMEAVVAEREANGPFTSIWDFAERVPSKALNKRQMEALITAGAFDALHPNRRQLFDACELIMGHGQQVKQSKRSRQRSLFDALESDESADHNPLDRYPKLPICDDWSLLARLNHEYNALGFYLSAHPLDAYNLALPHIPHTTSGDMLALARTNEAEQTHTVVAVVMGRKDKLSRQGNRFAFVQLSDPSGGFEATIFSEALRTYSDVLEPGKAVWLKIQSRWDAVQENVRLSILEARDLPTMCQTTIKHIVLPVVEPEDVLKWQQALEPAQDNHGMKVVFQLRVPCPDMPSSLVPNSLSANDDGIEGFSVTIQPFQLYRMRM